MTTEPQADWLQHIGGKWPSLALGYRYEVQLGKMLDEKRITGKNSFPYLRNVDVQWGSVNINNLPEMDFALSDQAKYSLRAGDLLVCEGGEVGRAALWPEGAGRDVYFQKALHRLRPYDSSKEFPRFMFYALRAAAEMNAYGAGGKTTIAHLPAESFRRIRFPKPPLADQQLVANFLDKQTARIDALIAQKVRLLVVLAEQRVSVSELVLKKNPTCTSGKLGFYVELLSGYAFPSDEFTRNPDDILLLRGVNVAPAKIRWDDTVYWAHDGAEDLSRFRLQMDDVVFGMDRPWISTGARVAMINAESQGALLLQRVCRLRGKGRMLQRFIFYALSSDAFRQSVEVDLTGVSVPHISPEQVLRFKVPVLTLDEQRKRCAVADSEIAQIANLEVQTTQMLDRLREYRSSLISAAVTGQLDINSYKEAA